MVNAGGWGSLSLDDAGGGWVVVIDSGHGCGHGRIVDADGCCCCPGGGGGCMAVIIVIVQVVVVGGRGGGTMLVWWLKTE